MFRLQVRQEKRKAARCVLKETQAQAKAVIAGYYLEQPFIHVDLCYMAAYRIVGPFASSSSTHNKIMYYICNACTTGICCTPTQYIYIHCTGWLFVPCLRFTFHYCMELIPFCMFHKMILYASEVLHSVCMLSLINTSSVIVLNVTKRKICIQVLEAHIDRIRQ